MQQDNTRGLKIMVAVIAALAVFWMMGAPPSYALFGGGKVDSFSADMVEIASGGMVVNTSKIYFSPDAMRMDGMPGMGSDPDMPKVDMSVLSLTKAGKSYIYNHDKKLVFITENEEFSDLSGMLKDNIESEKVVGKEKVSGYKCEKKEVVTAIKMMGFTSKTRMTVWESDRFAMPLKTMDENGNVQMMKNIKEGKPPKKMFRPLSGYQQVNNMMAVMGMDFAAMAAMDDDDEDEKADMQASEGPPDPEEVDAMLKHLEAQIGDNMSLEEKAQFMAMMGQAMSQAGRTPGEPGGAADHLWQMIPRRAGDQVGYEMEVGGSIDVIMGTRSSLEEVFTFYAKQMKSKGWAGQDPYIQNGQGMMSMHKDGNSIIFASADDPGMDGGFSVFYNIHYSAH